MRKRPLLLSRSKPFAARVHTPQYPSKIRTPFIPSIVPSRDRQRQGPAAENLGKCRRTADETKHLARTPTVSIPRRGRGANRGELNRSQFLLGRLIHLMNHWYLAGIRFRRIEYCCAIAQYTTCSNACNLQRPRYGAAQRDREYTAVRFT
jgi:hypothetical protein